MIFEDFRWFLVVFSDFGVIEVSFFPLQYMLKKHRTYFANFGDNMHQGIFAIRIEHLEIFAKVTEDLPVDTSRRPINSKWYSLPEQALRIGNQEFDLMFMTIITDHQLLSQCGISKYKYLYILKSNQNSALFFENFLH